MTATLSPEAMPSAARARASVGALVHVLEAERAELVDQRGLVGVIARGGEKPAAGVVPKRISARTVWNRWSGRSGWTMPARVSVTSVDLGEDLSGSGSSSRGSFIPDGSSPVSIIRRISAALREFR
jgi:hypothetical protein